MPYMEYQCRPIDQWPGALTTNRKRSPFRAGWGDTMKLLESELRFIAANGVVMLMALEEREIRLDGRPYANAKPRHPGVILSCTTKHGPMRMVCDRFDHWSDNVRAIALSLQSLRAVDRYGCTKRGEQYRGWTALPAPDDGPTNVEEAYELLGKIIGMGRAKGLPLADAIREAQVATHPDKPTGSAAMFKKVMKAKEILEAAK